MTEDTTAFNASRDPHGGGTGDPGGERPGPARRLERVRDGRLVTGVCAGLGRYTQIDPVVLRVGFAVLVFATFGMGTLLYVAAYLLMGEEGAGEDGGSSVVENLLRRRLDGEAVLAIIGALFALGVFLNLAGGGLSGDVVVVVTLFGLVLLVAHARGVDLRGIVRTLPDRLLGGRPAPRAPAAGACQPDAQATATPAPSAAGTTTEPAAEPAAGTTTEPATGVPPPPAKAPSSELIDLARLAPPVHGSPGPYPTPAPTAPHASARAGRRSVFTPLTLFAMLAAVAAMIPVAAPYSPAPAAQIVLAAGLGVVALGLFVGSWFGHGRGLVAVGTVLSLGLVSTSIATELPARGSIGDIAWKPVETGQLDRPYRIFAGSGSLDLTGLALRPGQRVKVIAEVSMGEFRITVPRATRVEVYARSGIGDITVDERLTGGVRASVRRVLPAEDGPRAAAPTIELHLRAGMGNLEVRRA